MSLWGVTRIQVDNMSRRGVVDQGQCEEKSSWERIRGKAGIRGKEVRKDP